MVELVELVELVESVEMVEREDDLNSVSETVNFLYIGYFAKLSPKPSPSWAEIALNSSKTPTHSPEK